MRVLAARVIDREDLNHYQDAEQDECRADNSGHCQSVSQSVTPFVTRSVSLAV
jgi:hypothetical protein